MRQERHIGMGIDRGLTERLRLRIGVIVTVGWVLLGLLLLFRDPARAWDMPPNEWGDFFAGAFAPLAFLWLVLGYFQQGQELKLNTKALRLQAKELKDSVEQQRALVEVTRAQWESDRQLLMPAFVLASIGRIDATEPERGVIYRFRITNAGHAASAFKATVVHNDRGELVLHERAMFERGAAAEPRFNVDIGEEHESALLSLFYFDAIGRNHRDSYQVLIDHDGNLSFQEVRREIIVTAAAASARASAG
jgi:hypothetical protein